MKTLLRLLLATCMGAPIAVLAQSYCQPIHISGGLWGDYIDGFQLGSIDNMASGYTDYPGYTDFTQQGEGTITRLAPGSTYTATIVSGSDAADNSYAIWVDLDQDGIFATAEQLYQSAAGINTSVAASIVVPASAVPGTTRMRVVMKYGSNVADACTSFSNGEVEDYCVNLVQGIGVNEIGSNMARVHPSPADDQLILTLAGELAQGRALLLVQDATGRAIAQQVVEGPRGTVNTGAFAEGLYHYSLLRNDRRLAQGRFVVVH
jgi:hypothetical protein